MNAQSVKNTVTDEELLQKYFGHKVNMNHNHEKHNVGSVNLIAIELRKIALAGYERFNQR